MSIRHVLGGVALFAVANLSVSTVFYTWIDPNMAKIQSDFESGNDGMNCDPLDEDAGDSHPNDADCVGGALARRDYYLGSNHVAALGRWYKGHYQPREFQLYFRYWF